MLRLMLTETTGEGGDGNQNSFTTDIVVGQDAPAPVYPDTVSVTPVPSDRAAEGTTLMFRVELDGPVPQGDTAEVVYSLSGRANELGAPVGFVPAADIDAVDGTATIAAGEQVTIVSVSILTDTLVERDESGVFAISAVNFTTESEESLSALNVEVPFVITDATPALEVSFSRAPYEVMEDADGAAAVLNVRGSVGGVTLVSTVRVSVVTDDMVATEPGDYMARTGAGALVDIPPGDYAAEATEIQVPLLIVPDFTVEPNERFTLSLMSSDDRAIEAVPSLTTVLILNDDAVVEFNPTMVTLERGASMDVTVRLSPDLIAGQSVTLRLTVTEGLTVNSGAVYDVMLDNVTTSEIVAVAALSDASTGVHEVTVTTVDPQGVTVTPAALAVTVMAPPSDIEIVMVGTTDIPEGDTVDDAVRFQFGDFQLVAGESATVAYTLNFGTGQGQASADEVIDPNSGMMRLTGEISIGQVVEIPLGAVEDTDIEGDEAFTLTFTGITDNDGRSRGVSGAVLPVPLMIIDDDGTLVITPMMTGLQTPREPELQSEQGVQIDAGILVEFAAGGVSVDISSIRVTVENDGLVGSEDMVQADGDFEGAEFIPATAPGFTVSSSSSGTFGTHGLAYAQEYTSESGASAAQAQGLLQSLALRLAAEIPREGRSTVTVTVQPTGEVAAASVEYIMQFLDDPELAGVMSVLAAMHTVAEDSEEVDVDIAVVTPSRDIYSISNRVNVSRSNYMVRGVNEPTSVWLGNNDPARLFLVDTRFAGDGMVAVGVPTTVSFTATLQPHAHGTATFTFTAEDSDGGETPPIDFMLTVTPVNDTPVITVDSPAVLALVAAGDPATVTVTLSDVDLSVAEGNEDRFAQLGDTLVMSVDTSDVTLSLADNLGLVTEESNNSSRVALMFTGGVNAGQVKTLVESVQARANPGAVVGDHVLTIELATGDNDEVAPPGDRDRLTGSATVPVRVTGAEEPAVYPATVSLSLVSDSNTVAEGADLVFEITLSAQVPLGDTATITYSPSSGAVPDVDDVLVSSGAGVDVMGGEATIAGGQTTAVISVRPVADSIVENDEGGGIQLSGLTFESGTPAAVDAANALGDHIFNILFPVDIVIIDATQMAVNVTAVPASGSTLVEGFGPGFGFNLGIIDVTASAPGITFARDVDVHLAVGAQGSTAGPQDYDRSVLQDNTFVFSFSSVTGSSVEREITVTPDTLLEGEEDLVIELAPPASQTDTVVVPGTITRATVTIHDNDLRLSVERSAQTVAETDVLVFTLRLSSNSGLENTHPLLNIGYAVTGIVPGDLRTDGTSSGLSGIIPIMGTASNAVLTYRLEGNDLLVEGPETAQVTVLRSGLPGGLSLEGDSTLDRVTTSTVVTDNTPALQVSFSSATYEFEENAVNPQATLNVTRGGGNDVTLALPVSVSVVTADGTGNGAATLADNDYAQRAGPGALVVIPAGPYTAAASPVAVPLSITDDVTEEGDETFILRLASSDIRAQGSGQAQVTILANDVPGAPPSITGATAEALNEDDNTVGGVTLDLSRELAENESVTVTYTLDFTAGNDRAAATDVNDLGNGVAALTGTGNRQVSIALRAVQDVETEGAETFEVVIASAVFGPGDGTTADIAVGGGVSPVGLTILPSDMPYPSSYSVEVMNENGTLREGEDVELLFTLNNPVPAGDTLTFETDVRREVDNAFAFIRNFEVTFEGGRSTAASSQAIPVDEFISLDTQGRVGLPFEAVSAELGANNPLTTFLGIAAGPQVQPTFTIVDATTMSVNVAVGSRLRDRILEGFEVGGNDFNHAIEVTVSSPANDRGIVITNDRIVTVNLIVGMLGTDSAGEDDYVRPPQEGRIALTIDSGSSFATSTNIATTPDTLREPGGEFVTIALAPLSSQTDPAVVLGATPSAVATIHDNDVRLSVGRVAAEVTEGGQAIDEFVIFTINLMGEDDHPALDIPYEVTGIGEDDLDREIASSSLEGDAGFLEGATIASQTYRTVPGDDLLVEGAEIATITVRLDDLPAGLWFDGLSSGLDEVSTSITVLDVTPPLDVSFSGVPYTVTEGGTVEAMLNVRSGVSGQSVTLTQTIFVSVAASQESGDAAVSPADFTALSQVVEVSSGAYTVDGTAIPVSFSTGEDNEIEGDETFTLTLSSSDARAVATAPFMAVVTIEDNDGQAPSDIEIVMVETTDIPEGDTVDDAVRFQFGNFQLGAGESATVAYTLGGFGSSPGQASEDEVTDPNSGVIRLTGEISIGQVVEIPLGAVEDTDIEGDEAFTLTFTGITDNDGRSRGVSGAVLPVPLMIIDDDGTLVITPMMTGLQTPREPELQSEQGVQIDAGILVEFAAGGVSVDISSIRVTVENDGLVGSEDMVQADGDFEGAEFIPATAPGFTVSSSSSGTFGTHGLAYAQEYTSESGASAAQAQGLLQSLALRLAAEIPREGRSTVTVTVQPTGEVAAASVEYIMQFLDDPELAGVMSVLAAMHTVAEDSEEVDVDIAVVTPSRDIYSISNRVNVSRSNYMVRGVNEPTSVWLGNNDPARLFLVDTRFAGDGMVAVGVPTTVSFTATLQPHAHGTATFTFTAEDSDGGETPPIDFMLTVTPVNDTPVITVDSPAVLALVAAGDPATVTVTLSDVDLSVAEGNEDRFAQLGDTLVMSVDTSDVTLSLADNLGLVTEESNNSSRVALMFTGGVNAGQVKTLVESVQARANPGAVVGDHVLTIELATGDNDEVAPPGDRDRLTGSATVPVRVTGAEEPAVYPATVSLSLVSDSNTVAEGADLVFEITLSAQVPLGDTATITYSPSSGAVPDVDDVLVSSGAGVDVMGGEATIAGGQTTAVISVRPVADSIVENDEGGGIQLSGLTFESGTPAAVDAANALGDHIFNILFPVDIVIIDATQMAVNVTAVPASGSTLVEGFGPGFGFNLGIIDVTASAPGITFARDVDVHLAVGAQGSTAGPQDYDRSVLQDNTFVFSFSSVTGSSVEREITVTPDTLLEGEEDLVIELAPPASQTDTVVVPGTITRATVTIHDNDLRLSVERSAQTVAETDVLVFTLRLSSNSGLENTHPLLNIGYAVTGIVPGDLRTDGTSSGLSGIIPIMGTASNAVLTYRLEGNDLLVEGPETAQVTVLRSGLPGGLSLEGDSTLDRVTTSTVVTDNTPALQVSFSSATYEFEENAVNPQATLNVTRGGGNDVTLALPVSVSVVTADGTGNGAATLADNDYAQRAGPGALVVIPAGPYTAAASPVAVPLSITDDVTEEGDETFILRLASSDIRAQGSGQAQVTILANDVPGAPPSITGATAEALNEDDNTVGGVTLDLSRELAENESVTVTYTLDFTAGNDRAAATDVNDLGNGVAALTGTGNRQVSIALRAVQDVETEGAETFEVVIASAVFGPGDGTTADIAVGGGVSPVGLTILPSDMPYPSSYSVEVMNENGTLREGEDVELLFTLNNPVPAGDTLTFETDVRREVDNAFAFIRNFEVTFEGGRSTAASSQAIPVDEFISLDTQGRVGLPFEAVSAELGANNPLTTFLGIAAGPQVQPTFTIVDATTMSVNVAVGSRLRDRILEGFEVGGNDFNHAIEVTVSSPANDRGIVITNDRIVTVNLIVGMLGTDSAGEDDYVRPPQEGRIALTIDSGSSFATSTNIATTPDTLREPGGEFVTIALAPLSSQTDPAVVLGATPSAVATIHDNDVRLSVGRVAAEVTEGGQAIDEFVIFTINLMGEDDHPALDIPYEVTGIGEDDLDREIASSSLEGDAGFLEGATIASQTYRTVPGDDLLVEGAEIATITVRLDDLPAGLWFDGLSSGLDEVSTSITVLDVTPPLEVSFSGVLPYTVTEGGTVEAMLNVRSGVSGQSVTLTQTIFVSVAASQESGDAAVSPADFTALSQVVEVSSGAYTVDGTAIPVSFSTGEDNEIEGDETFTLTLSSSDARAVATAPFMAVVTIEDNDGQAPSDIEIVMVETTDIPEGDTVDDAVRFQFGNFQLGAGESATVAYTLGGFGSSPGQASEDEVTDPNSGVIRLTGEISIGQVVEIPLGAVEDTDIEGDEAFTLTFTGITDNDGRSRGVSGAVLPVPLMIIDDDGTLVITPMMTGLQTPREPELQSEQGVQIDAGILVEFAAGGVSVDISSIRVTVENDGLVGSEDMVQADGDFEGAEFIPATAPGFTVSSSSSGTFGTHGLAYAQEYTSESGASAAQAQGLLQSLALRLAAEIPREGRSTVTVTVQPTGEVAAASVEYIMQFLDDPELAGVMSVLAAMHTVAEDSEEVDVDIAVVTPSRDIYSISNRVNVSRSNYMVRGVNEPTSVWLGNNDPARLFLVDTRFAGDGMVAVGVPTTVSFTATLQPHAHGTATFTFTAEDSDGGETPPIDFMLTVTPVNDTPVITVDSPAVLALVAAGDPATVTVTLSDVDLSVAEGNEDRFAQLGDTLVMSVDTSDVTLSLADNLGLVTEESNNSSRVALMFTGGVNAGQVKTLVESVQARANPGAVVGDHVLTIELATGDNDEVAPPGDRDRLTGSATVPVRVTGAEEPAVYPATVSLSLVSDSNTVAEGADLVFEITLSAQVPLGDTATITYSPSSGAVPDVDDVLVSSGAGVDVMGGEATIAGGQTTAVISVRPVADSIVENDEGGGIQLSGLTFESGTPAAVDAANALGDHIFNILFPVDIVIIDATQMAVNVTAVPASGSTLVEGFGPGFGFNLGIIDVTASAPGITFARDVDVHLAVGAQGSTAGPQDYDRSVLQDNTFVFSFSSVTGSSVEREITVTPDTLLEGEEDLVIELAPPASQTDTVVVPGTITRATVTIHDNDLRLSVERSAQTVAETDVLVFTLRLSSNSGLENTHPLLNIGYAVTGIVPGDLRTDGTSSGLSGIIPIMGTASNAVLTYRLEGNDLLVEGPETAQVTVLRSGLPGGLSLEGDSTLDRVTTSTVVTDNTPALQVSFSSATYEFEENAVNPQATLNVTRGGGNDVTLALPVSVSVVTADGTGNGAATLADNDYAQRAGPGALVVIPAGPYTAAASPVAVPLSITDDVTEEGDETFILRLASSDIRAQGSGQAQVTILANDVPGAPPSITGATAEALNEDDNTVGGVTLDLSRELAENESVTVTYTLDFTAGNDRAAATDVNDLGNGVAALTGTGNRQVSIALRAVQDVETEGAETFEVVIASAVFGPGDGTTADIAVGGGVSPVGLTILPSDMPYPSSYSVEVMNENGTLREGEDVELLFTLNNPVPAGDTLTFETDVRREVDNAFAFIRNFEVTFEGGRSTAASSQAIPVDEFISLDTQGRVGLPFEAVSAELGANNPLTTFLGIAAGPQVQPTFTIVDATTMSVNVAVGSRLRDRILEGFEVGGNDFNHAIEVTVSSPANDRGIVITNDRIVTVNLIVGMLGTDSAGEDDYVRPPQEGRIALTIDSGSSFATSTNIATTPDTLREPGGEFVTIALAPLSSQTDPAVVLGATPSAVATIHDNDVRLSVGRVAAEVTEGGQAIDEFVIFTINLMGEDDHPALDIPYEVTGIGEDDLDREIASSSLEGDAGFLEGATIARQTYRTVPGDDLLVEGAEIATITVRLDDLPAGLWFDGLSSGLDEVSTSITVLDVTPPLEVSFSGVLPYTVTEGGTVEAMLNVRSGVPGQSVTLTQSIFVSVAASQESGDAAVSPADFTALSQVVEVSSGAYTVDGTAIPVSFSTGEDNEIEGDETFTLTLSSSDARAVATAPFMAVVTIEDNDGAAPVYPTAVSSVTPVPSNRAAEGTDLMFRVELDGPVPAGETAEVVYSLSGRANELGAPVEFIPAVDTQAVDGTATIAAGEQVTTVSVSILTDTLVERDESGVFAISAVNFAAPGESLSALNVEAPFVIIDATPALEVSFSRTPYEVTEDVAGAAAVLNVRGFGGGVSLVSTVRVSVVTADVEAIAGAPGDYTARTGAGALVDIPPGDYTAEAVEIQVPLLITPDTNVENNETFTLTLSSSSDGRAVAAVPSVATVRILDDDAAVAVTVEFAPPAVTLERGASMDVTVGLDSGPAAGQSVTLELTAAAGVTVNNQQTDSVALSDTTTSEDVAIAVLSDAAPGVHQVTVTAVSPVGLTVTTVSLPVTVPGVVVTQGPGTDVPRVVAESVLQGVPGFVIDNSIGIELVEETISTIQVTLEGDSDGNLEGASFIETLSGDFTTNSGIPTEEYTSAGGASAIDTRALLQSLALRLETQDPPGRVMVTVTVQPTSGSGEVTVMYLLDITDENEPPTVQVLNNAVFAMDEDSMEMTANIALANPVEPGQSILDNVVVMESTITASNGGTDISDLLQGDIVDVFNADNDAPGPATVTFTATPQPNAHGTAVFALQAMDDGTGENLSSVFLFTLTVDSVNDAPVITVDGNSSPVTLVAGGTSVTVTVELTDVDVTLGNANRFAQSDDTLVMSVDADASTVTLNLRGLEGTVAMLSSGAVADVAGDGTSEITLTFSTGVTAIQVEELVGLVQVSATSEAEADEYALTIELTTGANEVRAPGDEDRMSVSAIVPVLVTTLDVPPTLTAAIENLNEDNDTVGGVRVTLSRPLQDDESVIVTYTLVFDPPASATESDVIQPNTGTVTLDTVNENTLFIPLRAVNDEDPEEDETFSVTLTAMFTLASSEVRELEVAGSPVTLTIPANDARGIRLRLRVFLEGALQ